MLTAAILILLVGQVSADIKCLVTDTNDPATSAVTPCDAGVKACFAHTAKDGDNAITYGCGDGTADCDKSTGTCKFCYTERTAGCNADTTIDSDFSCFDSATGVNKTVVCVKEGTAKCYTRTKVADDKVVEKGCGDGTDSTGSTWKDIKPCEANACNAEFFCFEDTGDLAGSPKVCPDKEENKCFTKTETTGSGANEVKTVTRNCGECTGTDKECPEGSTCTSNEINGCNEPERKDFTCVQKDDWQKNDTETKATPCDNVYTVSSCKTTTTTDTDGKVTVAKACGECASDPGENVECLACTTKGCNSATGLFSVLALTLAIIYQLL